jgi:RimJ/RimL family protein N-acetyltransferase
MVTGQFAVCPEQVAHCIVEAMTTDNPVLQGEQVLLEPLELRHVDGLVAASAGDSDLYRWSPVPQSKAQGLDYVKTALAWRDAGTAVPFAIVSAVDDVLIGSTRFWNIERWAWPPEHPSYGRDVPDACEIGYTWLAKSAIRTGANTEAKLLMLGRAFEAWQVLRVCLHTDVRNLRSRAAIERIGGKFEGVLRSHRMAADFTSRDSARYSIIVSEWPDVKTRLTKLLDRRP